ncbi:serine/threonine-protein phosphatase 6 regulatory subunit [Anaeramoeba flamelloides]|uniref:Serine/threonine-protein phosphatase 6 regulatory subunit n=1 Tax=Anaeramoeba flamelloides TaxID=1746091 RepID=A0ABQ8XY89_9EUKA|nr:serine/threonine-protein phosphatase 6 regulatory subunit [Anaeramoeba flamelloides]
MFLKSLTKEETIKQILNYLLVPPSSNVTDNKICIKYPFLSSEVIGCEIFGIVEEISISESYMDTIFAFLDQEKPINSVYAGYFARIVSVQLKKRWDETWKYIKENKILDKFLNNLESSAITDLLILILIADENSFTLEDVQKTVKEQKIVDKLINLLVEEKTTQYHRNSAKILLEVATFCHNSSYNFFYEELTSEEQINKIFDLVLIADTKKSISESGFKILIGMLDIILEDSLTEHVFYEIIIKKMEDLSRVLFEEKKKSLKLDFTDEVLGADKYRIIKFFTMVARIQTKEIEKYLFESKIIQYLIDIFFQYKWNNFLHNLITNFINEIFENGTENVKEYILINCDLPSKILSNIKLYTDEKEEIEKKELKDLEGIDLIKKKYEEPPHLPQLFGYLEHLIQISNQIVLISSRSTQIQEIMENAEGWDLYVNSFLSEQNQISNQQMGQKNEESMVNNRTTNSENDNQINFWEDDESFPNLTGLKNTINDIENETVNEEISFEQDNFDNTNFVENNSNESEFGEDNFGSFTSSNDGNNKDFNFEMGEFVDGEKNNFDDFNDFGSFNQENDNNNFDFDNDPFSNDNDFGNTENDQVEGEENEKIEKNDEN